MSTRERRGRAIKRPPSRLGRLLIALRASVGRRALAPNADPKFSAKAKKLKTWGLSRDEAVKWVHEIVGNQAVTADEIRRLESGRRSAPDEAVLKALLKSYGLSPQETAAVLGDPNLNATGGANPHLMTGWRMRSLALGEFGPAVHDAFRVGEYVSTWVEVEKGSSNGFRGDEVAINIVQEEVVPPPDFAKVANAAKAQNAQRLSRGIRGWTDNPTYCLRSVTSQLGTESEERNRIELHLQQSWYRFNVAAKQEAGAEHRWRTLQAATVPLKPEAYLAAGIGICVNVICNAGRSVLIGQRSNDETFRKGEFDVAVVEGIRPSADAIGKHVDIVAVAQRALAEELGLDKAVRGHDVADHVKRLVVFEFGCDLEFYQWNFLAFAEVNLPFDTLYAGWQKAKDRKENQTLTEIPCDEKQVAEFVSERPFWSAGMACALRTFDYL